MPLNGNDQNQWAVHLPPSATQREIERNIHLLKDMKQRQAEEEAARQAARPVPQAVPQGVTPTRRQAIDGIARHLRGLPIYEQAPAESVAANAAPGAMNTAATTPEQNRGFGSGGWHGWRNFAEARTAETQAVQQQPAVDFKIPNTYTGKTAEKC